MAHESEPRYNITFEDLLVGLDQDRGVSGHPFDRLSGNHVDTSLRLADGVSAPSEALGLREDGALVYNGGALTADNIPSRAVVRGLWRLSPSFNGNSLMEQRAGSPYTCNIAATPEQRLTLARLGLCAIYADIVTGESTDPTGKPASASIDRVYSVEEPFAGEFNELDEAEFVVVEGEVASYEPAQGPDSHGDIHEGYITLATDMRELDIRLNTYETHMLVSAEPPELRHIASQPLLGDIIQMQVHHVVDVEYEWFGLDDHPFRTGFALIRAGDKRRRRSQKR